MANGIDHTDAAEQAAFLAKSPSEQNLEIWLNGRETNGSVGRVIRDLAVLEGRQDKHDVRITRLEHWQIGAAAVIAFAIVVSPLAFFLVTNATR